MKKILSPAGEMLAVIRGVEVLPWGSMPHRGARADPRAAHPAAGRLLADPLGFLLTPGAPQACAGAVFPARRTYFPSGGDRCRGGLAGGRRLRVRLVRDAQGREKPLILGFAGREVCEQLTLGR